MNGLFQDSAEFVFDFGGGDDRYIDERTLTISKR
jgi:hypothetical protein